MFTVLSNTRNSNLYIITALAIMIVVLLTFAVVPSIPVPQRAAIPETNSQKAYVEFLSGEKVMYGSPARLSEALSAYHAGEKAVFAGAVNSSSALSTYRLGEKAIYENAADASIALSTYLAGEKAVYTNSVDLGTTLSLWRSGEKAIVRSDTLESALTAWGQGEKELK